MKKYKAQIKELNEIINEVEDLVWKNIMNKDVDINRKMINLLFCANKISELLLADAKEG